MHTQLTVTPLIHSCEDLCNLVHEYGFLPFMRNEISGFSVEDHTPPALWFTEDKEGPWEWKGPVIQKTHCAYGEYFNNKAGFISAAWFIDFANYRRNGYDLDTRYEDGLLRSSDRLVYEQLEKERILAHLTQRWPRASARTDFKNNILTRRERK